MKFELKTGSKFEAYGQRKIFFLFIEGETRIEDRRFVDSGRELRNGSEEEFEDLKGWGLRF